MHRWVEASKTVDALSLPTRMRVQQHPPRFRRMYAFLLVWNKAVAHANTISPCHPARILACLSLYQAYTRLLPVPRPHQHRHYLRGPAIRKLTLTRATVFTGSSYTCVSPPVSYIHPSPWLQQLGPESAAAAPRAHANISLRTGQWDTVTRCLIRLYPPQLHHILQLLRPDPGAAPAPALGPSDDPERDHSDDEAAPDGDIDDDFDDGEGDEGEAGGRGVADPFADVDITPEVLPREPGGRAVRRGAAVRRALLGGGQQAARTRIKGIVPIL